MVTFTPEEKNLVYLFDIPDRTRLLSDMKEAVSFIIYPDEVKLLRRTIDKLECMTDEEFAHIGLSTINTYPE